MRHRLLLGPAVLALVFSVGAYLVRGHYAGLQVEAQAELRVFAAASLNNAVKDSQQTFESRGTMILINAAGSDGLYQQVVSGSPADVYMAADFRWLNQLKAGDFLYQDTWNFTTNTIVVMLPGDNPKNITSLLDLVKPGVRIVIASWTVPAGKYANIMLNKIDSTWGNPASPKYEGSQWENYRAGFIQNVISYENSVEQVVGKVALGNCDAGIAYSSDAKTLGGSKLKQVQIPDEVNTLAVYAIGVVKASSHVDLAIEYVDFWLSTEGQALLGRYGFGPKLSMVSSPIWTAWFRGAHMNCPTLPSMIRSLA